MVICDTDCPFILIGIQGGGGVQLGPLDTAATNRPFVPAPGDYDVGEISGMIGRGNRSRPTRRKPAPVRLCPQKTPHAERIRTRADAMGGHLNMVKSFNLFSLWLYVSFQCRDIKK
jgi:hypothetical protein